MRFDEENSSTARLANVRPLKFFAILLFVVAVAGFLGVSPAQACDPSGEVCGESPPADESSLELEEESNEPILESEDDAGLEFEDEPAGKNRDPFEPVNRKTFGFNRIFDMVFVDPAARLYGWVMPEPVKDGARGIFDNLDAPRVVANKLLQGKPKQAGIATGRFAVNSTIGVIGIFDPAKTMGLEKQTADFGQTLYGYGMPSGPYIVIPLMGPTTVRDSLSFLVDLLLRPDAYLLSPGFAAFIVGGDGITMKEEVIEHLDILREESLDDYAMMRSLYLLHRASQVRNGAELSEEEIEEILSFGD